MGGTNSVEVYTPQSVEVFEGHGPIHRHPLVRNGAFIGVRDPAVTTMASAWTEAVRKFPKRNCMGTREALPEGKVGGYIFKDYETCNKRVVNVGAGLRSLGFPETTAIGLYAQNMESWVIAEQACYQHNYRVVSIYDTLGPDVCEYVINHAEIPIVFCQATKTAAVIKSLTKAPSCKYIVAFADTVSAEDVAAAETNGARLMSMAEFEKMGEAAPVAPRLPKPEDLCTIMYTSGTTGLPKGVMLSHGNAISVIAAALSGGTLQVDENDVHLSYLPLSHIFERIVMALLFGHGGSVAFFQGNPKLLVQDMQAVQPTLFFGVPRVFNLLYDRVMAGVKEAGFVKRFMFNTAYASKVDALSKGLDTPKWNGIVFNKIRDSILGSRCRYIVSGSAPLSGEVQTFLRVIFGCAVMQGYGLTETAAASTLQDPRDPHASNVGGPLPCIEVKLEDVPEINYFSSNPIQQGEVLIRGLSVFKGYYKNPEETAAVMTEDGWFHTGDIGQWNPNGTLSIIDRRKNIFKLSQGEYIAAEKLEVIFQLSSLIQQFWLYGDSKQSVVVAVVVPDPLATVKWAAANIGVQGKDTDPEFMKQMCARPELKKAIMEDMSRLAKEHKLAGFEVPKDIHLEHNLFSVENELLTPTFKLKRPTLLKQYRDIVDNMYKKLNSGPSSS